MNPLFTPMNETRRKPKAARDPRSKQQVEVEEVVEHSSKDIKRDLLALGIDLDESLIERMHRNLGISTTFASVAKASAIVQERKKVDDLHDVTFRHVQSPREEDPVSPTKSALPQFQVMSELCSVLCDCCLSDYLSYVFHRQAPKRHSQYFVD